MASEYCADIKSNRCIPTIATLTIEAIHVTSLYADVTAVEPGPQEQHKTLKPN